MYPQVPLTASIGVRTLSLGHCSIPSVSSECRGIPDPAAVQGWRIVARRHAAADAYDQAQLNTADVLVAFQAWPIAPGAANRCGWLESQPRRMLSAGHPEPDTSNTGLAPPVIWSCSMRSAVNNQAHLA